MEIYILRHALAAKRGTTEYPNDDRPLTKVGTQKMKLGARGIGNVVRSVDVILTSPLIRAADTAKIAAKALKYKRKILSCKELLPDVPTNDLLQYLTKFKQGAKVLLVGHEPGLKSAASALLGSSKSIIELKKGAMCRIDIIELPLKDPGKLIWHLTPKQLRALSSN